MHGLRYKKRPECPTDCKSESAVCQHRADNSEQAFINRHYHHHIIREKSEYTDAPGQGYERSELGITPKTLPNIPEYQVHFTIFALK